MEYLTAYTTTFALIWLGSIGLSILHSFFNDRALTVGDLFFMLAFGPLNTLYRYSDWRAVVIQWPEKKKQS
jgi:hypothetical protein